MHNTKTALTLLTLAAMMTGCGLQTVPMSVSNDGLKVISNHAASGKVRIAFAGLAAYKVLATQQDIYTLKLTLSSSGKPQVRELSLKELQKPMIYVDFSEVPAGKASLAVEAFDKSRKAIGKGENGARVVAGQTSNLHVAVKLDPNVGAGKVNAIITFQDSVEPSPEPRDCEERFRAADANSDGYVVLDEFRKNLPIYNGPLPMVDMPMADGQQGVACYAQEFPVALDVVRPIAPPCLPYEPGVWAFRQHDQNGDGRLTPLEYCSPVTPPPPMPAVSVQTKQ